MGFHRNARLGIEERESDHTRSDSLSIQVPLFLL